MTGSKHQRDVFDQFVATHATQLYNYALYLTWGAPSRRQDAEDAVQAVLLDLLEVRWEANRMSDWSDKHRMSYCYRALTNRIANMANRRWTREQLTATFEPDDLPCVPDASMEALDRVEVQRILRSLDPQQRAVLWLRYGEDFTEMATADCLRIPVGTVKSLTSRVLNQIRIAEAKLPPVAPKWDEEGGAR